MTMRSLVFVLSLASVVAADQFIAPLLSGSPEKAWSNCTSFDGFAWEGKLERRRVRAFVAATETHIHALIRSQLPAEGELVAACDKDSEKLVFDDSVEVWIDPTPGSESGAAYQLIANSLGRRYFAMHPRGNVKADPTWNGDWKVKCTTQDGWWDCEVVIPISSVAAGRKASDGVWGINLCRNWKNPWAFSSLGGAGYAPGKDIIFRFDASAPAIQHEQLKDCATGDVESILSLSAPGKLLASQRLSRDMNPEVSVEEKSPAKPLVLKVADPTSRTMKLAMRVASEDGKTIYYNRTISWKSAQPAWTWKTSKAVKPPIDIQFAYYPYLEKMRVLADISGLGADAKLDHLQLIVRSKDKPREVLHQEKLAKFDKAGRQEIQFALKDLSGPYELVATAVGAGMPKGEVIKPFERTRYEWEHNKLGRSTNAYPPFEPLKIENAADRQTVQTSLCQHRVNNVGLWDQVTATSAHTKIAKPILAAPMRYLVQADGKEQKVEGTLGARSDTTAAIHAGVVDLLAMGKWDIDGMMLLSLTVPPTSGHRIDALTLEIPFVQLGRAHDARDVRGNSQSHRHAAHSGRRRRRVGFRQAPRQRVPQELLHLHLRRLARARDLLLHRKRQGVELGSQDAEHRAGAQGRCPHDARTLDQQAGGRQRGEPAARHHIRPPGSASEAKVLPD